VPAQRLWNRFSGLSHNDTQTSCSESEISFLFFRAVKTQKPNSERKFQVCQNCGAWWEITPAQNPASPDYIFPLFLDEHSQCSQLDPEGFPMDVRLVRESEPEFKSLDPAKEWKPEQSPNYHPPVEPSSKPLNSVTAKHLLGMWTTFAGGLPEFWRFDKGGTGLLGAFSIACCEFKFKWRLTQANQMNLKLVGSAPYPPLDYFFTGNTSLTIEDRIDKYSRHSRVIVLKRPKGRTVELKKQDKDIWEEWKRSQKSD
jgi:hypothetical protein